MPAIKGTHSFDGIEETLYIDGGYKEPCIKHFKLYHNTKKILDNTNKKIEQQDDELNKIKMLYEAALLREADLKQQLEAAHHANNNLVNQIECMKQWFCDYKLKICGCINSSDATRYMHNVLEAQQNKFLQPQFSEYLRHMCNYISSCG